MKYNILIFSFVCVILAYAALSDLRCLKSHFAVQIHFRNQELYFFP